MKIGMKSGLSTWLFLARPAAITLALMAPVAAQAQFSNNYNFLKAVKDADGDKATELLQKPGSTVINSRDVTTGETALHIVIGRRDTTWLNFMLSKGANPNLADNNGTTPLLLAVQNRGETALIRAVQLRDIGLVRLLVAQGANADKRDTIAGMSARDYAERDSRTPGLVEALDSAKANAAAPKGPVQGPVF
ncbi:hypothetical protein LTR94_008911 [Friedmanniomyces endolithicus]|nr:hypothetical protein LTR94_008911 [Friedmanniomyces endolithicus]